ncbi:MAG: hypothetical protein AAGA96_14060, partial [Verrucomicrobiota bacterium]
MSLPLAIGSAILSSVSMRLTRILFLFLTLVVPADLQSESNSKSLSPALEIRHPSIEKVSLFAADPDIV